MGLFSGSAGRNARNAFEQTYMQEFGSYPPGAATDAVQAAVTTIYAHMGKGNYTYANEKLSNAIGQLGNAVGWNERKMEIGLLTMLVPAVNSRGKPAMGCGWAVDVITKAMFLYGPDKYGW